MPVDRMQGADKGGVSRSRSCAQAKRGEHLAVVELSLAAALQGRATMRVFYEESRR